MDYICDLLHFHLCDCGFDEGCENCPFDALNLTPLAGIEYLKELQIRLERAVKWMDE